MGSGKAWSKRRWHQHTSHQDGDGDGAHSARASSHQGRLLAHVGSHVGEEDVALRVKDGADVDDCGAVGDMVAGDEVGDPGGRDDDVGPQAHLLEVIWVGAGAAH